MLLWVDHFIYCTCVLPGPTTASHFDEAVGDEWIFCHSENNTQPALIVLCRVCLLGNILVGISKSEWEALNSKGKKKKKKPHALPISGPITTDPQCMGEKKTIGTKERTLCFCAVQSWAVCLSLSCTLKKCQEALCAGWWCLPVVFFFPLLTRENPLFLIMNLPFEHPLALTCKFKRTSISSLAAAFPLHYSFTQNSHICWLESCY